MPETLEQLEEYTEAQRLVDLELCQTDLFYLGRDILGYEDAEDTPHQELCDFIEMDYPKKLLVGCRGIYKTCFGTVARAIQLTLRDPNVRILIVQNNADNASKTVEEIRDHFENNEKLKRIRPNMIPEKVSDTKWTTKALTLIRTKRFREPTIMAAGIGTSLTSLHFDYILGDDVVSAGKDDMKEGGLMILRPEEVEKAIGWYKITMKGLAINRRGHKTQVQFIVNRWGVEDFANHILKEHIRSKDNPTGFECKVMAAHREDGTLLWPSVMTDEYLIESHLDMGDFMFNTQMECRPFNPAQRGFQPENNVFWDGHLPPNFENRNYRIYALMDIADMTKAASCYTAMVILWVDELNHIWVGEAVREKLDTVGKIALIHRFVKQYDLKSVCIEENLHKDLLRHVLKDEMKKAGIKYRIEPLTHKNRNKEARIMRLQPHHECGALHVKRSHKHLLQEMREFPYTHWKDTIDALGYIMDFIKKPAKFVNIEQQEIDFTKISIKDIKEERETAVYGRGSGPFSVQRPRNIVEQLQKSIA